MPKFSAKFLPLILLLLCTACLPAIANNGKRITAPTPKLVSASPQGLLESAESDYSRGQYQSAVNNYKSYFQSAPVSPRIPAILASYGLAAEKAGQFQDAITAYERLANEFGSSPFSIEAKFRLPEVYLASGDAIRAADLAQRNLKLNIDQGRRDSLYLTLAQAQWTSGDYQSANANFVKAWGSESAQIKTQAQEGILASLTRLNQPALEAIQKQAGINFPGAEATYLLARLAAQAGDKQRVTIQATYFTENFPTDPLAPQVNALLQVPNTKNPLPPLAFGANYNPVKSKAMGMKDTTVPATLVPLDGLSMGKGNYTVAVVLPLSAEGAGQYAQEVSAGLKLAVDSFAQGTVNLKLMDTQGSPEVAARLVNEAAADPQVIAVVGPFLSREAEQAAKAATQAKLPLIAISQRANLPSIGPDIFRIFLTPKHQAEAVARYAVVVLGHTALGIIYPDDNFGRPMKDYFQAEVVRLGGQVTWDDNYDPELGNWDETVGRLTGEEKFRRQVDTSYQAKTNFTALYLPDSAATASQILPLLALHDITRMQYLGLPLWLNQDFLTSSSRYIQGSVIPASISGLSQRPASQSFIAAFTKVNGREPDQFAAYGYDAGLAIIKALGQGVNSRTALRKALSQSTPVPGATGPFVFDAQGEYLVEPLLLSVKGKEFILLREPTLPANLK